MWVWLPEGRDSLLGTLRRGTVLQTDDSGSQQMLTRLRGLASEQFSGVYRAQPHGLSSHPPAGAEGIFLALGGRSDRLLALGFEHKDYRHKNLREGESVLYDSAGNVLLARTDKGVLIKNKDGHIVVDPSEAKKEKKVYLGGDPDKKHSFAKVATEAGPSPYVYARID
jgi:phage gp45-like